MAAVASGADWPQYRGPNHDGVSTDRILKQWSGSVTSPVWRAYFTSGLSSLAVSGGRVFTQVRRTLGGAAKEVCVALNATNGTELWARVVDDADYPNGGVGPDDGPRSTPAVDAGGVYVLGSYLKLLRLNAATGSVVWSNDLRVLFGGSVIGWQNAASPLVDGGLIYVNANGGTERLLALRTSDGGLAWRSQNDAMTHSTPVLATIHGVRQLIFATQGGLVSVDPQTGSRLWKFNYPFTYSTSLSVSPVVYEDMVFVCGAHGYSMGSVVMRASFTNDTWTTAQLWWTNNPTCHWMTPVCHQGFLYGMFGIQSFDSPNAQLKCIEMRTGVVKWSTNNFGRGGTLLVDDHLVVLTESGRLVLVKPDTNAYTELARFAAITNYSSSANRCWNGPAVSDGRVYMRSTAEGACFDLSMPELKMGPPRVLAAQTFRLTVRTVNGTPVNSNRLAAMEVRAATNPGLPLPQWERLTNSLVLTNGVIRVENVDASAAPRRYFIVSEPP